MHYGNIETFSYLQKHLILGGVKGTLLSAQNKGERHQAYPDQNNIYDAIYKIRISHKGDATDKH